MNTHKERIISKYGTGALFATNGPPDQARLQSKINDLAANMKAGHEIIAVISGAVGSGRSVIEAADIEDGNPILQKQILAGLGQPILMQTFGQLLRPHGIDPFQLLLTSMDFHQRHHAQNLKNVVEKILKLKTVLGLANENDSVAIDELKIGDNDRLSGLLAGLIQATRIIIFTEESGIYDRNPKEPGAKLIAEIHHPDELDKIGTSGQSVGGTGGMKSRIDLARRMMNLGVTMHVISTHEEMAISRILSGERFGTICHPMPGSRGRMGWGFDPTFVPT